MEAAARASASAACTPGSAPEATPRLIVLLTVDGLSVDQVVRHRDCFDAGGFEQPVFFTQD